MKNKKNNSGIPMNTPEVPSANEAGAQANQQAKSNANPVPPVPAPIALASTKIDTSLSTNDQLKQAVAQQSELSDQGANATAVLQQLIKAKQQAAPYDEAIQNIQENIGAKDVNEYLKRGIPLEKAMNFVQQDYARANSKTDYYRGLIAQGEQDAKDILSNFTNYLNNQLQGMGLTVSALQNQQNYELQLAQMARSGPRGPSQDPTKFTLSEVPGYGREVTFEQWLQQQQASSPNMSLDPSSPALKAQYESAYPEVYGTYQMGTDPYTLQQYQIGFIRRPEADSNPLSWLFPKTAWASTGVPGGNTFDPNNVGEGEESL